MHLNKGMKTTFGWGDQRGDRKEPTRVFRIEYIRLLIVVLPKNGKWIGTEYGTASGSRACIPNFRLENGRACDFNDFFMNFEKYKLLTLIASYLIICRINHSHQLAETNS